MDFFRKYIFIILTVSGLFFLALQVTVGGGGLFSGTIDTSSARVLGGDYRSYYFASKHLLAGENIYFSNQRNIKFDQEPVDTFVYPPLMAVFLTPLSLMNLVTSYIIFTVLSVVIFVWAVLLLSRKLPKSNIFFLVAVSAFSVSPVIVLHLDRGQTDIIILFLLIGSILTFLKKKSVLTGALVGVAAALKITPLIFLPYFFLKDKKVFWAAVGTLGAIFVLFSPGVWGDFFTKIHSFAGGVSSGGLSNSLLGVFYNTSVSDYYSQGTASLVYIYAAALLLGVTFFFIYKNREGDRFTLFEYGILTTFMMIIPPVSWAYNGVHSLFLLAGYWSIRFNGSLNKWGYFFFDILVYLILSQPLLSPLIRSFPIYHIFSLRPLMYLCFVALFIYVIHKEKINAYIAKFKLTRFYTGSFIRFCIVGFVGTVSNLLVFYLISKVANINIAAVGAFTFAVTQNYILNHSWSFRLHSTSNPNFKSYSRYVFVNFFGLSLNLLVLNILAGLGFNVLLAQAVGVIAGMSLNYMGSYFFVFVRKVEANI